MSGIKKRDFKFDEKSDQLFTAILDLKNKKESEDFFRDILTMGELQAITERFSVAQQLFSQEKSYRAISKDTGVSTATITRIAEWIKNGTGGYNRSLKRLSQKS